MLKRTRRDVLGQNLTKYCIESEMYEYLLHLHPALMPLSGIEAFSTQTKGYSIYMI